MRIILCSIFMAFLLLTQSVFAEDQNQNTKDSKALGRGYMPYSVMKDHIVVGREISGYTMRYDLAQQLNNFMVIFPTGYESFEKTPNYFAIDTLGFHEGSLKELFDADLNGIINNRPGTKVVKQLEHKMPINNGGQCYGAELQYPKESAGFPNELFYFCDTGSSKYAILLSLNAKSKSDLKRAYPDFLNWVDVPQVVKDVQVKHIGAD